MFCESCGTMMPNDARFCDGCGARAEPTQPVYVAAGQTPPPSDPKPPAYSPTYSPAVQASPLQRQPYVPPGPPAYTGQPVAEPLSVGQYVGMFLLMCIPILNLIMPLVWAFGGSVNPNRRNFARAFLILCVATLILWVGAWLSIGSDLGEMIDNLYLSLD